MSVSRTRDADRIRNYLGDESAAFRGRADELFLPSSEAEVVEVVREANRAGTPLTVSGGGTSITGSRVSMSGGAVLSVERLVEPVTPMPDGFEPVEGAGYRIWVSREKRAAIVPPAATVAALDAMLGRLDLLYPPDPTETTAMVGGTVATNASGARSFFYGPTRRWVRRIRVVLPTGVVAELRRGGDAESAGRLRFEANGRPVEVVMPDLSAYRMPRTKNAAGLYLAAGMQPIDLFIGCEGLLGIVTEVEVALVERPGRTLTVVAYFAERDDALGFVDAGVLTRTAWAAAETRRAAHEPPLRGGDGAHSRGKMDSATGPQYLSLEYFDGRSLDFMRERYPEIPRGVAGAVLFELPYDAGDGPYPSDAMLGGLERRLAEHGATSHWAVASAMREEVRAFRHALPEAVNEFVRRRTGKIGTDMAVPHERFREMMDAYERESDAADVRYLVFGHIGDDHVHLNYLPEDAAGAARAKRAYASLARLAVKLGGTISAEHGVGKKTIADEAGRSVPYLHVQYGPCGLAAIAAVKRQLDPKRILNIGNMVPAEMLG